MKESAELADFVSRTDFAALPREVVDQSKLCILDWLGVALGGCKEEPANIIANLMRTLGESKESTIMGTGWRTSCLSAALINGTASHILELDDLHMGSLSHPGVTTISAALAVAEKEEIEGKDLIVATVLGYEVLARVGMAVIPSHYSERHFHATGTCGTFGSAAASGKLLNLNEGKMQNALGIAGCQAAGLKEAFGTMCKPLQAGKAAENGVLAALLAHEGFSGPTSILEGPRGFWKAMANACDPSKAIDRLGEKFEIMNVTFKRHASCGASHGAIDTFLEIVNTNNIAPENIEKISVRGSLVMLDNVGKIFEPKTVLEAKFSLPYCLALAAYERTVDLQGFTPEKIIDRKLLEIARKVKLSVDSELTDKDYGYVGAKVTVKTKDKEEYRLEKTAPKGDPLDPLSVEDIVRKFRLLAQRTLTDDKIDEAVTTIKRLEKLKSISELTEICCR